MSKTATAPAPQGSEAIVQGIESLGGRLKKQEDILEGLLKVLEGPASKAGCSPMELLAKMSAGGTQPVVIGGDGAALAIPQGARKSIGVDFAKSLEALWHIHKHGANANQSHHDQIKRFGWEIAQTKTTLAETSGTTGGYTVPPVFLNKLMTVAGEESFVRKYASTLPMTAPTMLIPSLDVTTNQGAGKTAFAGGLQAFWTADNDGPTLTESEPKFRQTELTAWELAFYCVVSNTLIQDSALALESLLTTLFGYVVPWHEDYAYLQGDAVGKPQGILGAAPTLAVNRTTGSHVKFADCCNMMAKIYAGMFGSSGMVWTAHQSTIPDLLQLNDGSGSTSALGRSLFISIDQGAVKKPTWSLFGYPIIFTEKMPALGTKGDLALFNLPYYLVGDRTDTQIEVSTHVNFLKNQSVWRVICRKGGTPWLNNPITLADGTQTVSPFVVLN